MIPITRLSVGAAEAEAAAETIRSGWLAQGKRTIEFENLVAKYVGAEHAIAVSSCTTALHLALVVAGVGRGDEVICPSFSFIATANAIRFAGATPVFIDIEPWSYNIDPALIEKAITPRTKAILPVSQIGLPADLHSILEIARRHGLKVVEDAAPSLGAMIEDRFVGSISDFTCFSFDARKILTTGEGGVITTNDGDAAERLRKLRAHSASVPMLARHTISSVVLETYDELGFNYKLTDFQAAIGVVQMDRVEEFIAARRRLARRYNERLGGTEGLEIPYEPVGYRHVYQSYCVRLTGPQTQLDIMKAMAKRDLATRRVIAIHKEPAYVAEYGHLSLPHSEAAATRTLLLPMFAGLKDSELEEVASGLIASLRESATHYPADLYRKRAGAV